MVEYSLVGLAIAAVLIAGLQLRPHGILPSTGELQIGFTDSGAGVTMMMSPPSMGCHSNCNATSVLITVTSVEVHTSGIDNMTGEWTTVCDKVSMTVDLVQLQSITRIICGSSIKPETITNVRLTVSFANATIGGVSKTLTVQSGKLEIPVSPFANVEAGKTTTVVVQFQPHIVCTGNGNGSCKLTPVLHAMPQGPD